MRYFKNPYSDFSGGADPRDLYPDDAVKDDLERLLADIVSNAESYEDNYSGGIYVGPAGVAFALWYVSALRKQCKDPGTLVKFARRWVLYSSYGDRSSHFVRTFYKGVSVSISGFLTADFAPSSGSCRFHCVFPYPADEWQYLLETTKGPLSP